MAFSATRQRLDPLPARGWIKPDRPLPFLCCWPRGTGAESAPEEAAVAKAARKDLIVADLAQADPRQRLQEALD